MQMCPLQVARLCGCESIHSTTGTQAGRPTRQRALGRGREEVRTIGSAVLSSLVRHGKENRVHGEAWNAEQKDRLGPDSLAQKGGDRGRACTWADKEASLSPPLGFAR